MFTDWNHLVTFMTVARARSFAEAAAELRITPPAVSLAMKKLEEELGIELFEPIGRQRVLTVFGRHLLDFLERNVRPLQERFLDFISYSGVDAGTIRVGGPMPFSRLWLTPRVARFLDDKPGMTVDVTFGSGPELSQQLREGVLDYAILSRVSGEQGLSMSPLYTEEFVAVASPEYVKRRGCPRTADEYRKHRFITFDVEEFPHLLWWKSVFDSRQEGPQDVAARVRSIDEMVALAEHGVGICIAPTYVTDPLVERGTLVELMARNDDVTRRANNVMTLAWRQGLVETYPMRHFRALLLDAQPTGHLPRKWGSSTSRE